MKKKYNYIAAALIGGATLFTSCVDGFEEKNTDQSALSDELQKNDYQFLCIPMTTIQQGIYFNYDWGSGKNWPFQIMQNLGADTFSGYTHDCTPFSNGSNNSDYNLVNGWNASFWENTYAYVFPAVLRLKERSEKEYKGFYGVSHILKVELMHRVSDIYGPIIYTNFGDSQVGSKPDSQKDAYYAFFTDLDKGVETLTACLAGGTSDYSNTVVKADILTGKHPGYEQWIKFANSLRLRLAIRIAMSDPTKAKVEAQKAFANKYGFLEATDDVIAVSTSKGYSNPLGEINRGWLELNMNANMESILNGYQDPRISKYFEPSVNPLCKGEFRGIRQGTAFNHKNYADNSKLTIERTTDAILMTSAEVWFLRAEAALRNWSNESAADNYKKGVSTSFAQWGVGGADSYLLSDNVARDFVDVIDATNNIPAQCKVSPKWDDNVSLEVKLEKIITQKWIATYPEGCEAWAEQRRTGYPRLFPVKVNNSGGKIDTKIMIRRLNFPSEMSGTAPAQYSQLVGLLGGVDTGGTRLWWDTGRNF